MELRIIYFSRNKKCGFSINKVFEPIFAEISKEQKVTTYEVPCHHADPISIFKNLVFVFRHRDIKGINHITGDIHYCMLSLIGCKSVLTIHDVGFLDNPTCDWSFLKRKYIYWFNFYIPISIATKVTCISESTRNALIKYFPRRFINKYNVIHNSVDTRYKINHKSKLESPPFVLHIGTNPNKNLERTILALGGLDIILNIIGQLNKKQILLLNQYNISYINESGLTDAEILHRYVQCDIVSFPTLYEGFGMPIIEAQAVGRIVLTSKYAPMSEIAGDGACLINPFDIESIKDGFMKILNNENLRRFLVKRGAENIKRFDIQIIANQYINLYRKIVLKNEYA